MRKRGEEIMKREEEDFFRDAKKEREERG